MRSLRSCGQVPVFVLFYHRVADSSPNPWTMSCQEFARQIDWIEMNFQVVDLQECQRRINSGFNKQPTLAITFDDGYAENCEFALPLLIERRIPVTYFVTSDHTRKQQPFAHDVEYGQPLPVNTIESLRALDLSGVEIGAHSRTHADIAQIKDTDQLVDELITSSRELAQEIDRPIRYFAFPYGQRENLSPQAFNILKNEGFLGACTTLGGWNHIGGDAFQISRIHGDPNFSRLRNWLTYDPRLSHVQPYDYASPELSSPELKLPARKSPPMFPINGFSPGFLPQPTEQVD